MRTMTRALPCEKNYSDGAEGTARAPAPAVNKTISMRPYRPEELI
jgi:hypothetical protein